jgi:hypothetical protein
LQNNPAPKSTSIAGPAVPAANSIAVLIPFLEASVKSAALSAESAPAIIAIKNVGVAALSATTRK